MSIAVALTNGGSDVADFEHGIPFSEDVIVFTSNGDQVWRKLRGVQVGVGGRTRLEPGEQIRLETLWTQRDQDGFELPLGDYLVRGVVRIGDFVDGFYREMDLATEPYELIIQP